MNKLVQNLPIAAKVALAPLLAILCLLIVALVGRSANQASTGSLATLSNDLLPKIEATARLKTRVTQLDAMVMRSLAYEGSGMKASRVEAVDRAIDQDLKALAADVEALKQSATGPERALYEQLAQSLTSFSKHARDTLDLKSGGISQAAMMMTAAEKEHTRMSATVDQLVAAVNQRSKERAEAAIATAQRADITSLATLGCGILVALGVTAFVLPLIVRPLRRAVDLSKELAAGNLNLRIDNVGRDETGQVLAAMQEVSARLRDMLAQIQGAAQAIELATGEIAQGNLDLSTRTERTASELQQTASTMEHLSGQMVDSAQGAGRAHQLAAQAADVARQGGSAVKEAVTSMGQIAAQAHRIRDIVGVIDSLSFQTNILALNAAVEAARAGEHGRGFAVVAEEVRALAQRSAASAKEIRSLIGESVEQVGSGSDKAQAAGQIMDQVVRSIEATSDLITTFARTSDEQSSGFASVSEAVQRMDSSTQQNAALVEQASAATHSLQEQARSLMRSLAVFRTA
jgi:methyl-accepting chemotaxis protein